MELLPIRERRQVGGGDLVQRALLLCGVLSSLVYVVLNIVCAMLYDGYDAASQAVSELSAIGAPTRSLWVFGAIIYSLLLLAFGVGLWQCSDRNRPLRTASILLIIGAAVGLFWPPMHRREVLAAGGGTWTDTMHIVFTFIHVLLVIPAIAFAGVAFGRGFRIYSIITLIALIAAGSFTAIDGPKLSTNVPTPWMGVWERINIGVSMLWIAVLAMVVFRKQQWPHLAHDVD